MKAVPGEADEDETEATATIVSKKAQEKAMAAVTHEIDGQQMDRPASARG